jgi:hypothetical protein
LADFTIVERCEWMDAWVERMLQEGAIERFVLEVDPTQFNYKMIYLLIPGHGMKHNDGTLYDIINLVGDVIFV